MNKQEKIEKKMEHTVSVQSLKFSYSLYIPVKENKNFLRNVLPMDRKRNVLVVKPKWGYETEY